MSYRSESPPQPLFDWLRNVGIGLLKGEKDTGLEHLWEMGRHMGTQTPELKPNR